MTIAIRNLIETCGLLVCPYCEGEGDIQTFCGHESTETCRMCAGRGIIKSLKKQKHKKTCSICGGKGGKGCCDNKGFREWESFEIY